MIRIVNERISNIVACGLSVFLALMMVYFRFQPSVVHGIEPKSLSVMFLVTTMFFLLMSVLFGIEVFKRK